MVGIKERQKVTAMNQALTETTIDPMAFRNALGNFATGVTIVTARDDAGEGSNQYVGTTASSFNSVSLEPPLVLWSIDKRARSLEAYEKAEFFAVNVLAADQVSLSNHFARPQEDKFSGIDYELGLGDAPLLKGCAAQFECETKYQYEGGDHIIIVGEVKRFHTTGRSGLMFHRGKYVVSSFHPCNEQLPDDLGTDAGFVDDYLHYLVGRSFDQLMTKLTSVLHSQGLDENEYRVMASLGGKDGCSLKELMHNSILSEEVVNDKLRGLCAAGLLSREHHGDTTRIKLTDTGRQKLEPLLKVAKTNEAEALGVFTADEAMMFKRYLRRIIAWTE
jgi:3-hydroxy-9,10-secoandrosta-1,3,5(10)-triene-9,17-dione monooxygenase reductase component